LIKAKLEGKKVKYILEKTLHEYVKVAHLDSNIAVKDNILKEIIGKIKVINLNLIYFFKVINL